MNSMLVLGHVVVVEVEVHLALVHIHCLEPIEVAAWVLCSVPGFVFLVLQPRGTRLVLHHFQSPHW